MVLRISIIAVGLGLLSITSTTLPQQREVGVLGSPVLSPSGLIPWEIERLKTAYPGFIRDIDERYIYWFNGVPTDWREAGELLLRHLTTPPSYAQIMRSHPTRHFSRELVAAVFQNDEGRQAFHDILKKVYGETPHQVERNLRVVRFMPRTLNLRLRFNTRNGAADALEAVGRELDRLPASYHRYLSRSTSYINRNIRGSRITSLHSLGIAIDINPRYGDYWRWAVQATGELTQIPRNRIPLEIIEIFEKHGFLWGGRWYFYDTIHFEYRPELFLDRPTP